MKPILSVIREKNRYVYAVSYYSSIEKFKEDLHNSFVYLFGNIMYSDASIVLVSYSYKFGKLFLILKVKREYLKHLLASFVNLQPTHSLATSGTLKKLREQIKKV